MELATADEIISYSFLPGAQPHPEEPVSKDKEPDIGADKTEPIDNAGPQSLDGSSGGCNALQSVGILIVQILPILLKKRNTGKSKEREDT